MIAFPWPRRQKPPAPPPKRKRWFFLRRLGTASLFVLIAAFLAIVLFPYMVVTVPTGHVGVLWQRFNGFEIRCWCFAGRGTVLDPRDLKEEGLHIVLPWNVVYFYDLRLQTRDATYNAISLDGVNLNAQISIRFQLTHDDVPLLHKFIGPDYVENVLLPGLGARAREVFAQYTAEEIYSTKRRTIESAIRENSQQRLGVGLDRLLQMQAVSPELRHDPPYSMRNAINVYDTPVLGITLPSPIVAAINRKLEQYYIAQEYDFRIEREKKETERKRIEATGIHDFQQIVSQGISDSYLRWRGIEATLQLAQSPNAKVVIVGGGKDGLPIILNADVPAGRGAPATGAPPPGNGQPSTTPPSTSETSEPGKDSAEPGKDSENPSAAAPPRGSAPRSDLATPSNRDAKTSSPWSQDLSSLKDLLTGAHVTKAPDAGRAPEKRD